MEISIHQFLDLLRQVGDIMPQGGILERTELSNDAIDHRWTEYPIFLIYRTLLLQAVGRGHTAIGQLRS